MTQETWLEKVKALAENNIPITHWNIIKTEAYRLATRSYFSDSDKNIYASGKVDTAQTILKLMKSLEQKP